jgi:OOP family OmpA-OmpF porin
MLLYSPVTQTPCRCVLAVTTLFLLGGALPPAFAQLSDVKGSKDHPVILLDVIDAVPIKTGMVTIEAAAMAKGISSSGHVALYGIYFDTDKADLKPESQPTLQEIAKLLKQDPSLKLHIVGHTDNVGGFDYNIGLSERRAAAVVRT